MVPCAWRVVWVLGRWGLLVAAFSAFTAPAQPRAVVILAGGELRTPAYAIMARAVRETLEAPSMGAVEQYTEYLDQARFPEPEHAQELAEHLRKRYAGKNVAAVIAFDPPAVRFLAKYRDLIYPGVPVVFTGWRAPTVAQPELPPDFVGYPAHLEAAQTIRMALALRPAARQLVFVAGTAELDLAWKEVIRATPLPPQVRLRMLDGAMDETLGEVARLGPESVVLLGTYRRDGAGRAFVGSMIVLDLLKRASTAPIFHLYDQGVGHGAVASHVVTLDAIGVQAALIAKQILDGVPAQSVTMPPVDAVPVADWRELRRWGMDEARLPAGTVLKFREATFWEQYRFHLLAVAALLLLETALVAALLVQRRQRRLAEAQFRQSEQTMQIAASAAQIVLWNYDVERDLLWMSDSALEVGKLPAHPEQSLAGLIEILHEEDRDSFRKAVDRALLHDEVFESEYRVRGSDGVERWFASRGRVERVDGTPRRIRGFTLDVTRRKAAELDAQHQRNELAHLSRVAVLGELSGSVAHELNQPLMSILGNAQAARMFIGREPVDLAEIAEILDDIITDDKRAGEIIWGMRRMLKKEEPVHGPVEVNALVQEVLRLMRSDLMNRGVTLELDLAEDMPAVLGDRMQLHQVLLNLILNACDAMAAIRKEDRIVTVGTQCAGGGVRIIVSDRGEGIPPASLQGIFTPFFTTKKQGLGLGLPICSSIVASHGGELRAMNNDGRGATFTVELKARAVVPA